MTSVTGMPSRAGWTQQRIAFAMILLLAIPSLAACHRHEKVPDGDILATLTVPSIDERAFDPSAMKGKPTLLLFVTPTCPHCLVTLPRASAAAQGHDANAVAVFVAG